MAGLPGAEPWVFALLRILPMALVALPFIGYARTQRLQGLVRDPRLGALGLFFLLYGLAAVVQSGGVVAVWASHGPGPGPGPEDVFFRTAAGNASMDGRDGHFVVGGVGEGNGTGNFTGPGARFVVRVGTPWTFWLHHALVVAALTVACFAYLRPPQGTPAMAALPVVFAASTALQTAEAVLSLAPALLALLNWWRRRTRGSLQVAVGFGLLALSRVAGIGLVLARAGAFHPLFVVPVFDLLALAGITTLVFAVPAAPRPAAPPEP